jgi:hypothetical protein
MKTRNTQFDSFWNEKLDLKTNILNLFQQMPELTNPVKPTGFYAQLDMNFYRSKNMRQLVASTLTKNDVTLEEVYKVFCMLETTELNRKTFDLELINRITYALQKIDEEVPTLNPLREAVKKECERAEKEEDLIHLDKISLSSAEDSSCVPSCRAHKC